MSADKRLVDLFTAIKTLRDLPVMQIKENKELLKDLQGVLNSGFLKSLIADIRNDFNRQRNEEAQNSQSVLKTEDISFLTTFARYKSELHKRVSKGKPVAYTKLVTQEQILETAGVRNSKKAKGAKNAKPKPIDLNFKEAKAFKEVFNSIFSDKSLQIGTFQDPTILQSYIDYSPYITNYQYYLSIPTLSQTIDKGIQIATRELPELVTDDKELTDALYKYFKRQKFNSKVQKMLFNSHLSPRGSVMVPINEGGKVRFNVFNDTQFTYAVSPHYNKLNFRDEGYGVSQIFVLGYNLQNGVTCHFLCPGFEPIYGIGKNRIYQLKGAAEAINIYLYTIKVLCIRAQILVQKWGGMDQTDTMLEQLKRVTEDINSKLSLSTAVKIPEGAELEILNNNLNEGFAKVSPIIKEFQSLLAGIMPDYFYGSDTAYAANSFNIQVTHQNIRSDIQEAQIEPIYRFAINTLLANDSAFAKWKNLEDDFEINFKSLYEPTDVEKADIEGKRIDNIIKMSSYPELAQIFKDEGLLGEEYKFPEIKEPDTET